MVIIHFTLTYHFPVKKLGSLVSNIYCLLTVKHASFLNTGQTRKSQVQTRQPKNLDISGDDQNLRRPLLHRLRLEGHLRHPGRLHSTSVNVIKLCFVVIKFNIGVFLEILTVAMPIAA